MSRRRLTPTERRRRLAFRSELERMEAHSTATPVGLTAFAVGAVSAILVIDIMHTNEGGVMA